jgi:hypothetical protein
MRSYSPTPWYSLMAFSFAIAAIAYLLEGAIIDWLHIDPLILVIVYAGIAPILFLIGIGGFIYSWTRRGR